MTRWLLILLFLTSCQMVPTKPPKAIYPPPDTMDAIARNEQTFMSNLESLTDRNVVQGHPPSPQDPCHDLAKELHMQDLVQR